MASKIILLVVLCIAAISSPTQAQKCATCMDTNDAYCVDESTFYFCDNKMPTTTTLLKCPENQFCTNSENICETTEKIVPGIVKPCSSNCNTCPPTTATNKRYTCVSRTQFARCSGSSKEPTNFISSCPTDQLCSMENYEKTGSICAPKCVLDYFKYGATCANDLITTPTTTTTTTTTIAPPAVTDMKSKCKEADKGKSVYTLRNIQDKGCRTYIYCEKFDDEYEAILLTCSNYYDETVGGCVDNKPTSCN